MSTYHYHGLTLEAVDGPSAPGRFIVHRTRPGAAPRCEVIETRIDRAGCIDAGLGSDHLRWGWRVVEGTPEGEQVAVKAFQEMADHIWRASEERIETMMRSAVRTGEHTMSHEPPGPAPSGGAGGDGAQQAAGAVTGAESPTRGREVGLEAADRWIPVGERLPRGGVAVLVWGIGADTPLIGWVGSGQWSVHGGNMARVTHWRPLPAGPEG